jgi:hypothetical protein
MYELNLSQMQGRLAEARRHVEAAQQAAVLYEEARHPGWLQRLWTRLRRQPQRLLHLACIEAACHILGRHYLGIQAVPIAAIRGTESREPDFDGTFHPRAAHTRDRWLRIAVAQQTGEALPPVQLIQVGDIYFVRDGHHRISVAAALGQITVDAEVTVWHLAAAT